MSFIGEVFSYLGGVAAFVGIAAWVSNKVTEYKLSRDLERHRHELEGQLEEHKASLNRAVSMKLAEAKFEFDKELIVRKADIEKEMFQERAQFDIFRDELGHLNEKEGERQERVRGQILKWANPILGSIKDLNCRLENILENDGYLVLSKDKNTISKAWSIDYSYFMSSTIFYFAQYFCWTQLLKDKMSFELFQSQSDKDDFLKAIEKVGSAISDFPYPGTNNMNSESTDKQVFKLQQRAIGEALVIRHESKENIMTYKEFIDRWQDKSSVYYEPLEDFLRDLKKDNDLRWNRLIDMRVELKNFEKLCNNVLRINKTPIV